jgi:hypothetical protein
MLHWCCFVYRGCRFYVALVLFFLSRLSFLCCIGAGLSIQVVFFMLHWCWFVYPGCLFYVALVQTKQHQCNIKKTTSIDKTAPVQHKKDNLHRQNSTNATYKRQPG